MDDGTVPPIHVDDMSCEQLLAFNSLVKEKHFSFWTEEAKQLGRELGAPERRWLLRTACRPSSEQAAVVPVVTACTARRWLCRQPHCCSYMAPLCAKPGASGEYRGCGLHMSIHVFGVASGATSL
jgi:hypothetical protein